MVENPDADSLPPAEDRRLHQRLPIRGIALVSARGRAYLGEAVDISRHGVCLTLPRPLVVGSSWRLDLEIQRAEKRHTSVVARVCFCLEGTSGYRIGFNCSLAEVVS